MDPGEINSGTNGGNSLPWIISVDDHVTEPPDLWTSRLPSRYVSRGPRVERDRVKVHPDARLMQFEIGASDGVIADYWLFEGAPIKTGLLTPITHAIGFEKKMSNTPMTYDQIHPGCWRQNARLADMTRNHVQASLCFPNIVPRFCAQTFLEAMDKELGLLCVQAYNDWMIDEWCRGDGAGRLIPLALLPLWDPVLAAQEVERCAAKGCHAVSFCENPHDLGLPSVYDPRGWWDPFFRACDETKTNISMHIGSSEVIPTTASDAPYMMTSILMFKDSMTSMLDFILAGVFERFPHLTVAYSEGQIGWLPYAIRRADKVWAGKDKEGGSYRRTPNPPSSYIAGHVYGCIFDDDTALRCRDLIGMDQIMMEVDYPHSACAFPNVTEVALDLCRQGGLNESERYKLFRGNAINAYGLGRFGIES
jgi:predicted TIM-barrel fold metal-dependent hydrolase